MLKTHHLLSQVPLRADSAVRRLQEEIWRDFTALEVFAKAADPVLKSFGEASRQRLQRVRIPSCWGRLFDQRWCRVQFPRKTAGSEWFHWKDQGEATLYVDGQPYFGFDVAHKFCRLPAGLKEVWVEANCVQSAIWHPDSRGLSPQGSLFEGAFLVRRDEDAWAVFHDMKCLVDVALNLRQQENTALLPQVAPGCTQPAVERHSPAFRRMLRLLDDAVDAIDNHGLAAARKFLAGAYEELRSDRPLMSAVLTGHAHIDLVWLWPERIGELKAVHTFSTVNRLMEEYPEFRFAYSQPASYEAVERRVPQLYAQVLKRIRSGKWQATGAMYVESDTLIACGEALLRSFLVGQDAFTRINGAPSRLTWLPDVFGYSACLPQMMKLAGVEYFFTTKMTWNLVNRFPYSSFVWRGNDGSEVLAHVTQDCGYNSVLEAAELKNSSWGHQQGDIHPEYLLPTGYGDGGGGPTAEMCERARRLGSLPGMPAIEWGQPEELFARLAPLKPKLPVVKGECYLEGHRGTFTTHGEVKAAFRGLERALQVSEAVSCVTSKNWDRTHSWKRMIFSQFHDYIPGSSVWDVYQEGVPELQRLAASEYQKIEKKVSKATGEHSLLNPHAVEVSRWVTNPESKKCVRVRLPALSGTSIDAATIPEADAVEVTGGRVTNGLAEFRVDKNGWITHLVCEGKQVALEGPAGQLVYYRDKPSRFEAWDLDRQTLGSGRIASEKASITPFCDGPHRAGLRVRRKIGKLSSAEVVFYFEAGSPLLRVDVNLDWQDPYALLKFLMPTRYLATNARHGIPYGSVLRPQVVSGTVSEAMWEVPFSRWLAVFDEGENEGLFAVTDAKYGATVRDGTVGISLVRSPRNVGYDGMRMAWPPHLSRIKGPSEHTDIGAHSIRLAFGGYHGNLLRVQHPASLADTLFTDPVPYRGKAFSSAIESLEGGETLIPAWAMPVDADSWLLRLHEVGGQRGSIKIRAASGWKVSSCTATGQKMGSGKRAVDLDCHPYQIVSVRFQKQSQPPAKQTEKHT
jgi:alpha-mannosidase